MIKQPDHLPKSSGIYKFQSVIDSRFYIGSSKNLYQRYYDHNKQLSGNRHNNPYLQSFVNKHGLDSLRMEILALCEPKEMIEIEQKYIDTLDAINKGFNLSPCAQNTLGYRFTDDQKKNISKGLRNSKKMQAAWNRMGGFYAEIGRKHAKENPDQIQMMQKMGVAARRKHVRCINDKTIYESATAAAKQYGVAVQSVSRVARGERQNVYGLQFEYTEARLISQGA